MRRYGCQFQLWSGIYPAFVRALVLAALPNLVVHRARAELAAPQTHNQYCGFARDRQLFIELLKISTNNTAFNNNGGAMGISGVCWWQARFVRNATYLAIYRTDLPKPRRREADDLIQKIISGKSVVEIPGYRNLSEFTRDFEGILRKRLEEWQLGDTLFFAWTRGLVESSESPQKIQNKLDDLYRRVVVEKLVSYTMLKSKGKLGAHASLILGIDRDNQSYEIRVLDPNKQEPTLWRYGLGNANLSSVDFSYAPFTIYLQYDDELKSAFAAMLFRCNLPKARELWLKNASRRARGCDAKRDSFCRLLNENIDWVKKAPNHIPTERLLDYALKDEYLSLAEWNKLL